MHRSLLSSLWETSSQGQASVWCVLIGHSGPFGGRLAAIICHRCSIDITFLWNKGQPHPKTIKTHALSDNWLSFFIDWHVFAFRLLTISSRVASCCLQQRLQPLANLSRMGDSILGGFHLNLENPKAAVPSTVDAGLAVLAQRFVTSCYIRSERNNLVLLNRPRKWRFSWSMFGIWHNSTWARRKRERRSDSERSFMAISRNIQTVMARYCWQYLTDNMDMYWYVYICGVLSTVPRCATCFSPVEVLKISQNTST